MSWFAGSLRVRFTISPSSSTTCVVSRLAHTIGYLHYSSRFFYCCHLFYLLFLQFGTCYFTISPSSPTCVVSRLLVSQILSWLNPIFLTPKYEVDFRDFRKMSSVSSTSAPEPLYRPRLEYAVLAMQKGTKTGKLEKQLLPRMDQIDAGLLPCPSFEGLSLYLPQWVDLALLQPAPAPAVFEAMLQPASAPAVEGLAAVENPQPLFMNVTRRRSMRVEVAPVPAPDVPAPPVPVPLGLNRRKRTRREDLKHQLLKCNLV